MDEIVKYNQNITAKEIAAYEQSIKGKDPGIAVDTRLRFYELFLSGCSCEEIKRLNPGFALGSIVRCRIEELWDEKRDKYLEELYSTVREKVQTTTIESAHLISDLLKATNKYYKDKVKRFLQTGNPEDLPIKVDSVRGYKELFELLRLITGQDQQKTVSGKVVHTIEKEVESDGKIKPSHVGAILDMLDKHKDK